MFKQSLIFRFFLDKQKGLDRSKKEQNLFLLISSIGCSMVLSGGLWMIFTHFTQKEGADLRAVQSVVPPPPPLPPIGEAFHLSPFVVRMGTNEGSRWARVEISLQVTRSPVLEQEIQQSIEEIKDHLIFILSHKKASVFEDSEKLAHLHTEIIEQLNLFLSEGKVESVQIKETFLN